VNLQSIGWKRIEWKKPGYRITWAERKTFVGAFRSIESKFWLRTRGIASPLRAYFTTIKAFWWFYFKLCKLFLKFAGCELEITFICFLRFQKRITTWFLSFQRRLITLFLKLKSRSEKMQRRYYVKCLPNKCYFKGNDWREKTVMHIKTKTGNCLKYLSIKS
jgi:hypothetical protein